MDCQVKLQQFPHFEGLPLPAYQSAAAAGMDLAAALMEPLTLAPFERALISTGLAIELPMGYEAQLRPRSGLALRQGLTVLNSPGTIDADYRGEIQVILINLGAEPVVIERGMRIAQLVIAPCCRGDIEVSLTLEDSERGSGGFGHSGV